MPPSFEKYFRKEATAKEQETVEGPVRINEPRDEYVEGKLKLDVEYVLPAGELLRATENEEGIASVVIQKKDNSIIDLGELLEPGYKLVTPTYIHKIVEDDDRSKDFLEALTGRWTHVAIREKSSNKILHQFISVGDMRDPSLVFTLLHEMGHTNQGTLGRHTTPHSLRTRESLGAEKSVRERDAWARAIRMARELRREHDIDLFKLFEDWDHFKKFIYGSLITHRYVHQYKTEKSIASNKNVWQRIFGAKLDKKDLDYLKKLFDKEKFADK